MLAKICKENGIPTSSFFQYNRLTRRAMILDYWRDKGYISLEDWFSRAVREIFENFERETRECQHPETELV